jgi:hypothetical protein
MAKMNPIDTTHYLFPKDGNSETVNVLPWLDESISAPSVNQNPSSETQAIDPVQALRGLQTNFAAYDKDSSGAISHAELLELKGTDAVANWALERHMQLADIAKADYSHGFVGMSEDIIARNLSIRRAPLRLADSMFSDDIPSLSGISNKDLTTALEVAEPNAKFIETLENSAESERKSRWAFLATSILDATLTTSMFKLGSRFSPWAGYIAGGLFALGGAAQFNHFLSRGQAENTREIEDQVNKTRQMLGLNDIISVVDAQKPKSEEQDEKPDQEGKKEIQPLATGT